MIGPRSRAQVWLAAGITDIRCGMAETGRLWVYLRDDRPGAGHAPPAVWPTLAHREHPAHQLEYWRWDLQAVRRRYPFG